MTCLTSWCLSYPLCKMGMTAVVFRKERRQEMKSAKTSAWHRINTQRTLAFIFTTIKAQWNWRSPGIAAPQLFLPPSPKRTSTSLDLHTALTPLSVTGQGTLKSSHLNQTTWGRTKAPSSQSASLFRETWGPERARKEKGVGQGKAGQPLYGSGEGLGLQFPLGIRTPQAGGHTGEAVEPPALLP